MRVCAYNTRHTRIVTGWYSGDKTSGSSADDALYVILGKTTDPGFDRAPALLPRRYTRHAVLQLWGRPIDSFTAPTDDWDIGSAQMKNAIRVSINFISSTYSNAISFHLHGSFLGRAHRYWFAANILTADNVVWDFLNKIQWHKLWSWQENLQSSVTSPRISFSLRAPQLCL